MKVVDLVVADAEQIGRRGMAFDVRVRGDAPHLSYEATHLLDQAAGARGDLGGEALTRSQRDVLHQIAAALELGHDAED